MTANESAFAHARAALELISDAAAAAVIMRHAERGKFAYGHHGNDIPLTDGGKQDAFDMGKLMEGRIVGLLHSPVPRCMDTAAHMNLGGNAGVSLKECMGLRCDVYVHDFNAALETLGRLVQEKGFYDVFVNRMSTAGNETPYDHFKPPLAAAGELVQKLLPCAGLQIGITHDWLVNVAASYASGTVTERPRYAGFLDALFVWREKDFVMFYYKGETGRCPISFQRAVGV